MVEMSPNKVYNLKNETFLRERERSVSSDSPGPGWWFNESIHFNQRIQEYTNSTASPWNNNKMIIKIRFSCSSIISWDRVQIHYSNHRLWIDTIEPCTMMIGKHLFRCSLVPRGHSQSQATGWPHWSSLVPCCCLPCSAKQFSRFVFACVSKKSLIYSQSWSNRQTKIIDTNKLAKSKNKSSKVKRCIMSSRLETCHIDVSLTLPRIRFTEPDWKLASILRFEFQFGIFFSAEFRIWIACKPTLVGCDVLASYEMVVRRNPSASDQLTSWSQAD